MAGKKMAGENGGKENGGKENEGKKTAGKYFIFMYKTAMVVQDLQGTFKYKLL